MFKTIWIIFLIYLSESNSQLMRVACDLSIKQMLVFGYLLPIMFIGKQVLAKNGYLFWKKILGENDFKTNTHYLQVYKIDLIKSIAIKNVYSTT